MSDSPNPRAGRLTVATQLATTEQRELRVLAARRGMNLAEYVTTLIRRELKKQRPKVTP